MQLTMTEVNIETRLKSSVFCLQHTAIALLKYRRRNSVTAFSNSDETYINGIRRKRRV